MSRTSCRRLSRGWDAALLQAVEANRKALQQLGAAAATESRSRKKWDAERVRASWWGMRRPLAARCEGRGLGLAEPGG